MQAKTIVITGAFGTLGRSVTARAKAAGAALVLVDHAAAPDDVTPGCLVLHGVDLTDSTAAARAMDQAAERGGIDALLNIAGGFAWQTVAEGDVAGWERMFTLNLKTAFNASKAALPHLAKRNGAIVNVGANAALKAGAGMGAYTASKAGVHKLTESMAEELKGKVRVNAVLPSVLDTQQNRRDMPNIDPAIWVKPEELAEVMLFLASDAASAVTGALVPVTGRV